MNAARTALHLDTTAAASTLVATVNGKTFRARFDGERHQERARAKAAQVRMVMTERPNLVGECMEGRAPKSPRKGVSVIIDGVKYETERRFCHGFHFELVSANGERKHETIESLYDGQNSGRIFCLV